MSPACSGLAAVGQLHGHEAAAAEVARGGIHHRQRVAHGDRRIDGIAAVLEDIDADLAGQMLRGDDHAVFGRDRCLGSCVCASREIHGRA